MKTITISVTDWNWLHGHLEELVEDLLRQSESRFTGEPEKSQLCNRAGMVQSLLESTEQTDGEFVVDIRSDYNGYPAVVWEPEGVHGD